MSKDEELEQLRAENQALCEELQRKDDQLQQGRKANEDLREGLKQAIRAMSSQQERIKTREGYSHWIRWIIRQASANACRAGFLLI